MTGRSNLSRRSYLRMTGAAALAAAGVGTTTADLTSYDRISVPAGDVFRVSLEDDETFANRLIDITADGADVSIRAYGSNWAIRNVGIRGAVEARDDPPVITVADTGDGSSKIENVYMGDGGKGEIYARAGIYVHNSHSGTVTIDGIFMRDMQDNGIYASAPGNPDTSFFRSLDAVGANGTVEVSNCYFENIKVDAVRLGSNGSFARNVVAVECPHRGFWQYWRESEWRNCDAYDCARSFEASEDRTVPDTTTVMHLENCRANTSPHTEDGARLSGSIRQSPRRAPPTGVPRSPKAGASGMTDLGTLGTRPSTTITGPRT